MRVSSTDLRPRDGETCRDTLRRSASIHKCAYQGHLTDLIHIREANTCSWYVYSIANTRGFGIQNDNTRQDHSAIYTYILRAEDDRA